MGPELGPTAYTNSFFHLKFKSKALGRAHRCLVHSCLEWRSNSSIIPLTRAARQTLLQSEIEFELGREVEMRMIYEKVLLGKNYS